MEIVSKSVCLCIQPSFATSTYFTACLPVKLQENTKVSRREELDVGFVVKLNSKLSVPKVLNFTIGHPPFHPYNLYT